MVEKVGHIKNPLTVIAIFAGIAEISGTGILPFIDPTTQGEYIWFLMLFPSLLVGLFFITLNFNHKVLYAPSDYKDEEIFLKLFDKPTPEEREKKFRQEIDQAKTDLVEETSQPRSINHMPPDLATLNKEIMATYSLAEKLAITKLSKELKLDLRQEVKFLQGSTGGIIFDGGAIKGNEVHAVEVKVINAGRNLRHPSFFKLFKAVEDISNQLNEEGRIFIFHFAAVVGDVNIDIKNLEKDLKGILRDFRCQIEIHVWRMIDLEQELLAP